MLLFWLGAFHVHILTLSQIRTDYEKQSYQVHFGIFFHNALVFLRIVAVPAVTLPIVVQVYLYLTVFVWSDTCACKLCANFSGSLLRQTWGVITCLWQNVIVISVIQNLLKDQDYFFYLMYLQAVLLFVRNGATIFTSSFTKFSSNRSLVGGNHTED